MRIRVGTTTAVAVATAGALALTACGSSGGGSSSGGSTSGGGLGGSSGSSSSSTNASKTYTLGFIGALSGAYAQLGINERNGAALAIAQYNAKSDKKFTLTLDPQDSEGDPAKAPAAATSLISNSSVVGVIGPAFSGESKAVDSKFCSASIPIVTASASAADLASQGYKCWHRIIPNDNVEGAQGAEWLARTGSKKVFVLSDLSAYGAGVAKTMADTLKTKGVTVVTGGVDGTQTKNYDPIANTIASSGADALFYGGYDSNAALLARALVKAGFKGRKVTGNGGKSSVFTTNSGSAGNGWYFTCGCQDATVAPAAQSFASAYQTKYKTPPSTYSPEAYDAANLFIAAMEKASASGTITRASLGTALNQADYKGITATLAFQSNGEVKAANLVVNLFQQQNGVIKGLGDINSINK